MGNIAAIFKFYNSIGYLIYASHFKPSPDRLPLLIRMSTIRPVKLEFPFSNGECISI